MLFNIALVVALIVYTAVFLLLADKFINIGIKMAQKGDVTKVSLIPKIQKKMKESPEAKATRERIELINGYAGYKER